MAERARAPRSRGYRKREKTRGHLIEAGLRVLAEKGHGLTVSDVVAEADVSNGTFYNYFVDRDALLEALAEHLALSLAAAVAQEPVADPARRFALATGRVLQRAREDEIWARAILRLASRPEAGLELDRYLREDLAEGQAQGRFQTGPDDTTLDQVTGLILMTIRRIAAGQASPETIERAIGLGLRSLGLDPAEASAVAADAVGSFASTPSLPAEPQAGSLS